MNSRTAILGREVDKLAPALVRQRKLAAALLAAAERGAAAVAKGMLDHIEAAEAEAIRNVDGGQIASNVNPQRVTP